MVVVIVVPHFLVTGCFAAANGVGRVEGVVPPEGACG